MSFGHLSIVLGTQWGDEGKGKLVDILSEKFDWVARATGGANAGHTVYVEKNGKTEKYVFHLLPSGILYEHVRCLIGNGVVLHVETFFKELQNLAERGMDSESRVKISDRASLLFDYHKIIDGLQEDAKGDQKVGTTRRGIGPAYSDKVNRRGIRLCDLKDWAHFEAMYRSNLKWHQDVYGFEYDPEPELKLHRELQSRLMAMSVDGTWTLNQALKNGETVLVEGANAALLDLDHGTYPYVTSSNPSIGGVFTGTGLSPLHLKENIGIVKAYMSRVGAGPFPTELENELGETIRQAGGEFGSTTGRPRRCGWFDSVVTRYGILVDGCTALNLTKLDVLDDLDEIKIAVAYRLNGQEIHGLPALLSELEQVEVTYESLPGWKTPIGEARRFEDLPINAQNYVLRLENLLGCPIRWIGVGQRRDQMIDRNS